MTIGLLLDIATLRHGDPRLHHPGDADAVIADDLADLKIRQLTYLLAHDRADRAPVPADQRIPASLS